MQELNDAAVLNGLLDALPPMQRKRLLADTTRVSLRAGEVLLPADGTSRHVYFPVDCSISMLATADAGSLVEVRMIGNEGMCGYPVPIDRRVPNLVSIAQGNGTALRIATAAFRQHVENLPAFGPIIRLYLGIILSQLAQAAACMHFHVVERRLARWLSMARDRRSNDSLDVTQEFIAHMLGVRRVGVTKAAGFLQDKRLISYARGHMTILNRRGLALAACGCYAADLLTYSSAFARLKGRAATVPASRTAAGFLDVTACRTH